MGRPYDIQIKAYATTNEFHLLMELDEFADFEIMPGEQIIEYVTVLCDAMEVFEEKSIRQWDAESLTKVLTYWLPKHADLMELEIGMFVIVTNSFIHFLHEKNLTSDTLSLLLAVAQSGPLMVSRSEDESFWSEEKRESIDAFNELMEEELEYLFRNDVDFQDSLANIGDGFSPDGPSKPNNVISMGRTKLPPANAPCPCGSGKTYKDCHGDLPF